MKQGYHLSCCPNFRGRLSELRSDNPDLAPVSGENRFNSLARSSGPESTLTEARKKVRTGASEPDALRSRLRGEHYSTL
jgi:hypothetical protein